MTEEQKEILRQANIPITWWELCIIKDGVIYTPSMEVLHENNLVSEEEYQYWLSQQEQIGVCHEPTVEEKVIILEKTIANLEIELLEIK